jgi:serine/threonine protein phosphatase 1
MTAFKTPVIWKMPLEEPRLPAGLRIYAIGDVHGRADLLVQLFEMIDADLKYFPVNRALHVFLGDYIDRGPQSRDVIDLLVERRRFHEAVCLRGNHEEVFMGVMRENRGLQDWRSIGGFATLLSYGINPGPGARGVNETDLIRSLKRAVPSEHVRFLASLQSSFLCGDFLFVHAGIRPGIPLDAQSEDDLLWIRSEFLDSTADFGKFIVHGHTPVDRPDVRSNRINIDTGAYATGNLTLLTIEEDRLLVLT